MNSTSFGSSSAAGSPGFAEAVLDTAQEMAEGQGVKLNIEALIGASQYFPNLAKRL
jgi:hypothetical protein